MKPGKGTIVRRMKRVSSGERERAGAKREKRNEKKQRKREAGGIMKFQLRKNGGSSHGMVTRMQINRRPCRSRSAEKRERQKLRTAIIALKGSFSRRERMNGNRNIVGHRFFLLFLFFSPFFFLFPFHF